MGTNYATLAATLAAGSPVWPATRSNLLSYCRTQRESAKVAHKSSASAIRFSIWQAQRYIAAHRTALARLGGDAGLATGAQ